MSSSSSSSSSSIRHKKTDLFGESAENNVRFLTVDILPRLHTLLSTLLPGQSVSVQSHEAELDLWAQWLVQTDNGGEPALLTLADRFNLDVVDRLILCLAVAPYLSHSFVETYRQIQQSLLTDRCSVATALAVIEPHESRRLLQLGRFEPESPLFRSALLTLQPPGGSFGDARIDQLLCVPQRTIDAVLGRPKLDDRVRPFCAVEWGDVPLHRVILHPERRDEVLALVRHHTQYRQALRKYGFDEAIPYGRGVVLLFSGPPGTGKTMFARALSHSLQRPLLRVLSDKLAQTEETLEAVIQGIFHEAVLFDALLFFDECEALFRTRGSRLGLLLAELERYEGITILSTNMPQTLDTAMDRRIVYRMDFDTPDAHERLQIWEVHLPPEAPLANDVDVQLLANLFNFSGGLIKNAVLVALNQAISADPANPIIDMATLRKASESQLASNLEDFADRSKTKLSLDDLVLPIEEREKINEIIAACRNKDFVQNKWGLGTRLVTGKGISILFDGPPGTGKTLCAEIIARDLRRPLYRVNIPNVVSKWVGETEKNIAEIFNRAKATQAMLLFDEADSLFAKRTEVKSSNDRYANQEVNLLLQEIERFEGIVLMTTNLFGGLDDALKRRIQYRVTFPTPTAAERERIWRTLLPAETPLAKDVDLAWLAKRFEFSGGNIKNAIVRASYRAFADNGELTHEHLRTAARLECEASGILIQD
ncbi:MAG: AAA family ATPase [Myxococcales bacterium]|nr:AAA family ATPase [Myxococcales bacterium]